MILWEMAFILLSFLLVIIITLTKRKKGMRTLREIPAFSQLKKTIELSIEDGSRLQISLGSGGILGPQSSATFVALSLLKQVAHIAADSDQPPVATSGEGLQAILSQDTLRRAYQEIGISEKYYHRLARITGLTPNAYGAGSMPMILDNYVLASTLVGSFGEEAALITSASQRRSAFSIGGSDKLSGQSILFASTVQPLIGEELYATGAYMDAGPAHHASLHTQDILRWVLIVAISVLALRELVIAVI